MAMVLRDGRCWECSIRGWQKVSTFIFDLGLALGLLVYIENP